VKLAICSAAWTVWGWAFEIHAMAGIHPASGLNKKLDIKFRSKANGKFHVFWIGPRNSRCRRGALDWGGSVRNDSTHSFAQKNDRYG
jgi:hypothetical protein